MLLVPGEALVMLPRDPGGAPRSDPGGAPRSDPGGGTGSDPGGGTGSGPGLQASGAPAIAAWVAAGLGTPTVFLGAIGDDEPGRLVASTLAGGGVDPAGLIVRPELPTATARVEYFADGSRAFEFAVAGSAATSLRVDDLGDLPERCTWIHVSGSAVLFGGPLAEATVAAVRRARAGGATVSVDPNLRAELTDATRHRTLRDLCRTADALFPSDDELPRLGLDEDELAAGGVVVCRTMAAAGARLRAPGLDVVVPTVAEPDAVLDPDGAGDTFAAAVIAARLRGLDWDKSVEVAALITARAIGVPGPMTVPLSPADVG